VASTGHHPTPRSRPQHEHAAEHAALASPTRLRLLEALRRNPSGGHHPDDLADDLDLHPSTVRGHLSLLTDAGFAEPVVERRRGPGRPRVLFVPTTKELPDASWCDHYRGLAKALSSYLTWDAASPTETGTAVGRRWAADLAGAERSRPRARSPLSRIRELLAAAGFATETDLDADGVVLVHPACPFAAAVEGDAGIVCAIHLGLAAGLVDQVTGRWEVTELASSVDERTCTVRLRPRTMSGFSEPATGRFGRGRAARARRSGAGDDTTVRG
jgi:predicted ArsR family transcriptional regulator